MTEKILLKDQLLNLQRIANIAEGIYGVYPGFDKAGFSKATLQKFPELELKARIAWTSQTLRDFLPKNYNRALKILLASLSAHDHQASDGSDFGIFTYAPYPNFVATYGCDQAHRRVSLQALKEITKHFTAEDAIRYFINAFPRETMAELLRWSQDSDYRVRRLASEGTRPILPWSPRISTPPKAAIPILDNLFADTSRFVTRSVANHLNDISRTDPALVIATLQKWQASGKQSPKEMDFIIRQSLRTLIKTGHRATFEFLNFSANAAVQLSGPTVQPNPVRIGKHFELSCIITALKDERLLIDYVLYFPNKAGAGHNKKVFKWKILDLAKDQTITLIKRQPMLQRTTRKLYPGTCKLALQINGKELATTAFELTPQTS